MQAWVFLREGEERIKASDWARAAAIAGSALARELDPAARDEIVAWAADIPLRWSQHEMRRGDFSAALDVLAARLAGSPPDRRIGNQIAYVVQEQLRAKAATEGPEAAEGLIPAIVDRFARIDAVRQVIIGHLQRAIGRLSDEGRYEAALAAADRFAGLAPGPSLESTTKARIYDHWALALAKERKYGPALDVYDKALPVVGDQGHARNNVRFILQEWLKDIGPGDPDGARVILQRELARFAAVPGIADVGKAHVARRVQELVQQGLYEPALATLQSHSAWIADARDTAQIAASVFDRWSQALVAKRDWLAAADVYQRALQQYPKNAHLENNALATWQQWARTFVERKDWSSAIGVYEQALQRFPGNSLLDNNIKYCREQMRKSG
jgi:tetratricopeptide (TPR) repeat protein